MDSHHILLLIISSCAFGNACCKGFTKNFDSSTDNTGRIIVKGPWLKDSQGRARIFHGFNVVQKSFPWYSKDLLNDTILDLWQSWGFNVVRFGIMWSGFEPTECSFNWTYIKILKTIVQKLGQRGIYVILDLHQDVLSSKFGTYDGIPEWLLKKLPPSENPYPWPLNLFYPKGNWPWFAGYLSEAAGKAFQGIYFNASGSWNYFSGFWKTVAVNFKDFKNVIGYELINEPWAGDIYSDPSLLAPGIAGMKNLQPFYNELVKVIRKVDNDTLIFYEPVTWGVFFNGEYLGTGFNSVPGGKEYQNRSVLSYHYYCWFMNQNSSNVFNLSRLLCKEFLDPQVQLSIKETIGKIGGSSFMTEFGLCYVQNDFSDCITTMNLADKFFQSWTYWNADFFEGTGQVRNSTIEIFSRPYAVAISGEPLFMHFNQTAPSKFVLRYKLSPEILAPSLVFLPATHFPNGFSVSITSGLVWEFDQSTRILSISIKSVYEKEISQNTVNLEVVSK